MEHLAIYLPTLHGGGAEKMLLHVAGELENRGFDVDLIIGEKTGELLSHIPDNVQLVDLDAGRIANTLLPLTLYLRREKPDRLLSTINTANVVAILASKLSMSPTGTVIRMPNTEFKKTPPHRNNLMKNIEAKLIKWTYPHAGKIIAISKGSKQATLGAIPKVSETDVRVIYNPVLRGGFEEKMREEISESWYPDATEVILGVGRLVDQKDFSTLLRAFAELEGNRKRSLVILGKGPNREHLSTLASELGILSDVYLPGFVDNPFKFMRHARLFALTSRFEPFGNVLVETMACGTPVVSTDCPFGPSEILEEGKHGILVPLESPRDMAKAIEWTLNHPVPPDQLKRRASQFTVKAIVDEYIKVLEEAKSD
jgi:glycosyltransferase involved in cell wall biosynthesis